MVLEEAMLVEDMLYMIPLLFYLLPARRCDFKPTRHLAQQHAVPGTCQCSFSTFSRWRSQLIFQINSSVDLEILNLSLSTFDQHDLRRLDCLQPPSPNKPTSSRLSKLHYPIHLSILLVNLTQFSVLP